jgi:hypothetical protein
MSYTGLTNRLSQVYSEKQRQEYKKNAQKRKQLNQKKEAFAYSNKRNIDSRSIRTRHADGSFTPYGLNKKEAEANRQKKRFNIIFYSLVFLLIVLIGGAIGIYYMLFANKNKNKNTDNFISNNTDNKHSYILYFITFLIFISAILYLVQNN